MQSDKHDRIIVCDQIGRGNFLGLYFSAGAISSFTSLACNVLRARFHIYALGASGAISGVIGAFTYFNPEYANTQPAPSHDYIH